MGFISDRFDLEKQITFYLSYHDNKVNQAIHLLCIWPIFISGIMILAHTDAFAEQPAVLQALPFSEYMVLNYSAVMAVIYMAWYIALDAMYVLPALLPSSRLSMTHSLFSSPLQRWLARSGHRLLGVHLRQLLRAARRGAHQHPELPPRAWHPRHCLDPPGACCCCLQICRSTYLW